MTLTAFFLGLTVGVAAAGGHLLSVRARVQLALNGWVLLVMPVYTLTLLLVGGFIAFVLQRVPLAAPFIVLGLLATYGPVLMLRARRSAE